MLILELEEKTRKKLWENIVHVIEDYTKRVKTFRVTPELDPHKIRALLKPFDFKRPLDPLEAVNFLVEGLCKYQVHAPHPRYFGLFNPAPTTMGIAADTLVAAFNPQLATWSHSPLAVEIERHLVRAFGSHFGYDQSRTDGTFATGGAEANHTAMLTALVHAFPKFSTSGLRGLEAQPVLYVSTQSHHSFIKAARLCGLGTDAVRNIPTNDDLQLDVQILEYQIEKDRNAGFAPFMVVATAGTTNAGVVDPISRIEKIAARMGLWFHVDAAWGGAAALVREIRHVLDGIERSNSITFDAHKWLSVPMAAGIYLTRHPDILNRTFCITADYMPKDAAGLDIVDPYLHSIQCSRRFIGLKVFLSLAAAGWDGYADAIRHQVAMGELMRRELEGSNWKVVNKTSLPVVCFVDLENQEGSNNQYIEAISREVVSSGKSWISTTYIKPDTLALRACITNYRTESEDVVALVQAVNEARKKIQHSS